MPDVKIAPNPKSYYDDEIDLILIEATTSTKSRVACLLSGY